MLKVTAVACDVSRHGKLVSWQVSHRRIARFLFATMKSSRALDSIGFSQRKSDFSALSCMVKAMPWLRLRPISPTYQLGSWPEAKLQQFNAFTCYVFAVLQIGAVNWDKKWIAFIYLITVTTLVRYFLLLYDSMNDLQRPRGYNCQLNWCEADPDVTQSEAGIGAKCQVAPECSNRINRCSK